MRLIDAGALIAEMHNVILEDGEDRRTFYEVIERQPTIEKRKTGKWIDGYKRQTCSVCKQRGYRSWNFCPNCGSYNGGDKDDQR